MSRRPHSRNTPVIRDLWHALIPWIIRVKPEGNTYLFKQVRQLAEQGLIEEFKGTGSDGVYRRYRLAWNVPLNESNPDMRVDFLDVWEPGSQDPEQSDTFILDPVLGLCRARAELLMWGGLRLLENRKRNVQHVEEPGLSLQAQLWPWIPASIRSGDSTAFLGFAKQGNRHPIDNHTIFRGTAVTHS